MSIPKVWLHTTTNKNRYGTEEPIGKAIRSSGIPRNELFVTTKLWNNAHHPDDVPKSLQGSLGRLGLDYVDLLLIHWPVAWKRGEEPFPKDSSGKPILENIDWLDVCLSPSLIHGEANVHRHTEQWKNSSPPAK